MKKNQIISIVIAAVGVIIMLILIQVAMAASGNVTYYWQPLIYVGIAVGGCLGISIVSFVILSIIYASKAKKMKQAYNNKQYDTVIKLRDCNKILRKGSKEKDAVYYLVAVSYLETGDLQGFLEYINKISSPEVINTKYLWMGVYSLMTKDEEHFAYWLNLLQNSSSELCREAGTRTLGYLHKNIVLGLALTDEEKAFIEDWHSDVLKNMIVAR